MNIWAIIVWAVVFGFLFYLCERRERMRLYDTLGIPYRDLLGPTLNWLALLIIILFIVIMFIISN